MAAHQAAVVVVEVVQTPVVRQGLEEMAEMAQFGFIAGR